MRESGIWKTMKSNLGGLQGLDMQRIENSAGIGTPDLELCFKGNCGWVEGKLLKEFPKRPTTKVKLDHYTNEQKLWARKRVLAGGNYHLFVQVGKEYFLFDLETALILDTLTADEWRIRAKRHWVGRCNWLDFLLTSVGIDKRNK